MKKRSILLLAALLSLVISACKKDSKTPGDHDHSSGTDTPAESTGSIVLKFENKFGNDNLILDLVKYTNATDTFQVSTFNYYISNIKLTAADKSVYSETESYHLVKAADAGSLQFNLGNVPVKEYTAITFMIGVDSTRNVSGSQTGALDPANGHFWSWNSGYIMAKLEATSPQSTATGNMVMFHVGGFSGANSVLKTVSLPLTTNAKVSTSTTPQVTLKADLKAWFSPHAVSFSTLNTIHMPGTAAKKIADNYANMFAVTQVTN